MKKKKDSREKIFVPRLGWLSGDKFSDHGNTYTASVDSVRLDFNAFCYKLVVDKKEEGNFFIAAESYDVLTKNEPETHKTARFPLPTCYALGTGRPISCAIRGDRQSGCETSCRP